MLDQFCLVTLMALFQEILNDKLKAERELKDMVHRYNQLDEKFKDIERKCQDLQLAAYEAKEKLAQGQAEYQIKVVVLDEEARRLKQKQRDEIKELEANKAKEVERVKDDFEQTEKSLRERLNKLEARKHSLEDVSSWGATTKTTSIRVTNFILSHL